MAGKVTKEQFREFYGAKVISHLGPIFDRLFEVLGSTPIHPLCVRCVSVCVSVCQCVSVCAVCAVCAVLAYALTGWGWVGAGGPEQTRTATGRSTLRSS